MTRHFCTNFDTGKFLLRGLALYFSLERQGSDFVLWNLCMDEESFAGLSKLGLKNLRLVRVSEIENDALRKVKATRTLREYCLTVKPHLLLHLLKKYPGMESVTWLDADLYFFGPFEEIFKGYERASIILTPNNFPADKAARLAKICGTYNAGLFTFKNDAEAVRALQWWGERCIEWCFNFYEDGKLGEQLYMDEFPKSFKDVAIVDHPGINTAYWNLERFDIEKDGSALFIAERKTGMRRPLIVYHFSGVTLYKTFKRIVHLPNRRFLPIKATRFVYRPYIAELNRALALAAERIDPSFEEGLVMYQTGKLISESVKKTALAHAHELADIPAFKKRLRGVVSRIFPRLRSYSLNDLDLRMKKYIGNRKNGFFVEAGANNGIAQSNTLYYERNLGWKGLLVEPIPALAEQCRKNRPGDIVENAALVPSDFKGASLTMRYCDLMSVVKGGMRSAAEEEAQMEYGRKLKGIETYDVEVPIATLESLLVKHKIDRIDFLSLDVEGFELRALKGLDFKVHRPDYILVEARYLDEIDRFMTSVGYKQIDQLSIHDFLYAPNN